MRFDWLAPPPAEAVVRGLELLHALGALDGDARWAPRAARPNSRCRAARLSAASRPTLFHTPRRRPRLTPPPLDTPSPRPARPAG
jgi:hypothetical protein